jgi:hypothetical protein
MASRCAHAVLPVLQACTAAMNLSEEVDLEDYVARPDRINNAEIASICQVRACVCLCAIPCRCVRGRAAGATVECGRCDAWAHG